MANKARISGQIVFLLGIALLTVTLILALLAFLNPDRVGDFGNLIPPSEETWGGALEALGYAVAIGLLLVMGSIGGRIAALGIRMFKAEPSSETDQKG